MGYGTQDQGASPTGSAGSDWTQRLLSPGALTPASLALLLAGRQGSPASQLGLGLLGHLAAYQMQEPERQAKLEERKRQHDLQYGQTDIGPMIDDLREAQGMPRTNQPKVVSRWAAPSYIQALSALGRVQPDILFDPESGAVVGEARPGQERTPVLRPSLPPPYRPAAEFGAEPGPSLGETLQTPGQQAGPGQREVRAIPVKESSIPALQQYIEKRREWEARPQNNPQALAAFNAAAEAVRGGTEAEAAWNQHGLGRYGWTWQQFQGYTPATPKTPPALHMDSRTGEIIQPTPGVGPGFNVLRPGKERPEDADRAAILAERRKALEAQNRAREASANIEATMASGKPIPTDIANRQVRAWYDEAARLEKAAQAALFDEEAKQSYEAAARFYRQMADRLTKYQSRTQPGSAPTQETEEEVAARLFGGGKAK